MIKINVLALFLILWAKLAFSAASGWSEITGYAYAVWDANNTVSTTLSGGVRSEDGAGSYVYGILLTHESGDGYYIKALNLEGVAVPITTVWYLAEFGGVMGPDTIGTQHAVELCGYDDFVNGGNWIEDPTNFYLAFSTEDWDDFIHMAEDAHVWYGWVNLRVNEEGGLEVLGSGVNIDGGPVVVGETLGPIPEPSSALLAMLGLGFLALRRRRSMC